MKTLFKITSIVVLLLFTVKCGLLEDDLLDNPLAISPEQVSPDFLLNNIQLQAHNFWSNGPELRGRQLTRMTHLQGANYQTAFSGEAFNGAWGNAYNGALIDIQNLLPIAEENGLNFHSGIAKVLQAQILIGLVDLWGDIPWSQALDADNFNPGLDSGEQVYDIALSILDDAISDLQAATGPVSDLYYPGLSAADRADRWIRVANTLKFKSLLNMKHIRSVGSELQALINSGMLITEPEHDFLFRYSINDTNPDSRHPLFTDAYEGTGAGLYIGVTFLNKLMNDKAVPDPRIRYYFYRQTTQTTTDVNEQSCLAALPPAHFTDDDPFCQLNLGYWGRDFLITDGIPPDSDKRTVVGVYPAGGEFDANQGTRLDADAGLRGAGIRPILMSQFTHFMIAEAIQTVNGVTGDARATFQDAVQRSIDSVMDFGSSVAVANFVPSDGIINTYMGEVMARFDSNPMRAIANEYYIALWGNGYEAYNLMRRTGYPNREDGIQPARAPNPGAFVYSMLYPANVVNRNANISQKASAEHNRVFWDTLAPTNKFDF